MVGAFLPPEEVHHPVYGVFRAEQRGILEHHSSAVWWCSHGGCMCLVDDVRHSVLGVCRAEFRCLCTCHTIYIGCLSKVGALRAANVHHPVHGMYVLQKEEEQNSAVLTRGIP